MRGSCHESRTLHRSMVVKKPSRVCFVETCFRRACSVPLMIDCLRMPDSEMFT